MDNQNNQPKPRQYEPINQKLNLKQYKPMIKQEEITEDNKKNNQTDSIDKIAYLVDEPNNPTSLNDSNIPKKEEVTRPEYKSNNTKYIAVSLLATLIYVTCAWIAQAQLVQIIDLEVPLVVLLSLIITYVAEEKQLTIYGVYLILAAIIFLLGAQYSFIISIALISHVFIDCIEKIQTNERDYKVSTIS